MATLLEMLLQMTNCKVSTDCKGGNPTGKAKLDRLKKSLTKKKGGAKGRKITFGKGVNHGNHY